MSHNQKRKIMKTLIITVAILLGLQIASAQEKKIFSLSPMSKDTKLVNGMVIGIGHFSDSTHIQRINGLNVDVNIFSLLIAFHPGPKVINYPYDLKIVSNGVNVGIGGYTGGVQHNGLTIQMYNEGLKFNGIGIHAIWNDTKVTNGICVSGFFNLSEAAKGINISLYNNNKSMTGIQLGIRNSSLKFTGLQIGVFNTTEALRGLQLGFWNRNGKRSLPFINF